MKELGFDSSVDTPVPAYHPQFDDERTLLSARPVVPLEKIDARVRNRRRWFLAGAFAIAMLLGAASALVASYLKLRNLPDSTAEASQEGDTPAPLAIVESTATDPQIGAAAENFETVEEPVPTTVPQKTRHQRLAVRPNLEPLQLNDSRALSEEDELHRIREAVLYDEWQERRARRATRRERRRVERYNHRDLSNLDEIFEGPRRPGKE
jgi:hypothetical protein